MNIYARILDWIIQNLPMPIAFALGVPCLVLYYVAMGIGLVVLPYRVWKRAFG